MVTKILQLKLRVVLREDYRLWRRVESSDEDLKDVGG
jgi:hypothetical protein